jgi:diadenosine tetraphosphate (Ap4A) HIT family hydrolase
MSASRLNDCPFCQLPPERILDSNEHAVAVADAFPVAPGHTLIVLRRHTASLFDVSSAEAAALFQLLHRMQQRLAASHQPDGYTVGVNDGPAAGQTVPHLHVHLIPRHAGDVLDPRGGVGGVMPGRALYG